MMEGVGSYLTAFYPVFFLTLTLLTWTKWRAPTNASKWRMGFNSAFKGFINPTAIVVTIAKSAKINVKIFVVVSVVLTEFHLKTSTVFPYRKLIFAWSLSYNLHFFATFLTLQLQFFFRSERNPTGWLLAFPLEFLYDRFLCCLRICICHFKQYELFPVSLCHKQCKINCIF
jgi:hypothetical protein